jgi:hypothetical protein
MKQGLNMQKEGIWTSSQTFRRSLIKKENWADIERSAEF